MSKAIYKPKGKAGEYAEWACNLYVGCSNNCSYCYCKKGLLSHAMGGPEAKPKACFKDEQHAFEVFVKELDENIEAIRQSSLFFTFSSDPMIPQTRALNIRCIRYAIENTAHEDMLMLTSILRREGFPEKIFNYRAAPSTIKPKTINGIPEREYWKEKEEKKCEDCGWWRGVSGCCCPLSHSLGPDTPACEQFEPKEMRLDNKL